MVSTLPSFVACANLINMISIALSTSLNVLQLVFNDSVRKSEIDNCATLSHLKPIHTQAITHDATGSLQKQRLNNNKEHRVKHKSLTHCACMLCFQVDITEIISTFLYPFNQF